MKVLFVRPRPSEETIGLQHVMIVEPLELEVLASLVEEDDKPVIIDMILEKDSIETFIEREKPDILCVTGYITNVPAMIDYCAVAKTMDRGIITIVGGVHCEVCPEDLDSEYIDYRVVRNATRSFPGLLGFLRNNESFPDGVLKKGEICDKEKLPEFDYYFPRPDRSLTQKYRNQYFYIFHEKVALIKTSFGCPFDCNFCFCREITCGNYHERPIDHVIDELKLIRERNIYIVDDDFLTSRKRVESFIEANISNHLNKKYLLYGRADFIAHNPDLMQRFYDVGLRTVIVGFESFIDAELERYNKNTSVRINEEAMQILNQLNIECYATIIVSPDWGREEFEFYKNKFRELGIHYVNLQPLTPLPGTDQMIDEKELLIPYSEFEKWDLAHITIKPTKMSVADFYRSILKLYYSILFQSAFLFKYLRNSRISMVLKMLTGSSRVTKQYKKKIKEAVDYA